uniref:WRKY domain-containing protein n=1 Tax=Leersia perrieri TaxID=77586 RepID=A0A0D9WYJ8_9ORYZ
MAGGDGGTAATKKHILRAQKSTNQLKALLQAEGGGGKSPGAVVEMILSDISDSLSQALASVELGASGESSIMAPPPEASLSSAYGGGRWPDPGDAYPWRKYGQKGILGSRFARNYYRCAAQRSGCSAKKQVHQSDDDPSQMEVTYIGSHTCDCDDRRPPSCTIPAAGAAVMSSALQKLEEHVPELDMMMAVHCNPSMEEEDMAAPWLFIPSPACSQSELLPEVAMEVPELKADADVDASQADPVELDRKTSKKANDEEFLALYDSVVPDLV